MSLRKFYRPELDLLRLLAFFMIYIHHTLIGHGNESLWLLKRCCAAGMQLFFVLSSFLITELLLREFESTATIHLAAFFKRRMLRIWPLYFCFLFVYMAVTLATHARSPTIAAFLSFLLLSGNWYMAFHGFLPPIISPLWSISLEEQYYLLWPFVGRSAKRGLWIVSLIFFAGAYLALFQLGDSRHSFAAVWTNSFVEFQFFATGAILALLLHERQFAPHPWLRLALLGTALTAIYCAEHFFHFTHPLLPFRSLAPAFLLLVAAISSLFLSIYGITVPDAFRPLLYLGKISYGLYIFHMVALFLSTWLTYQIYRHIYLPGLRPLLTLALTITLASLSYRFLELPFLRLKRRFEFIATRIGDIPRSAQQTGLPQSRSIP